MSTVLQRTNALEKYRGIDKIACCKCPQAMWHQVNDGIRCHCTVLSEIVFQSCSKPDFDHTTGNVVDCDSINRNDDEPILGEQIVIIKTNQNPIGALPLPIPIQKSGPYKRRGSESAH